jgi:hypothetical protein
VSELLARTIHLSLERSDRHRKRPRCSQTACDELFALLGILLRALTWESPITHQRLSDSEALPGGGGSVGGGCGGFPGSGNGGTPGIGSRGGSAGGLGIWVWIITLHYYHKSSRTCGSMPGMDGFRMKEALFRAASGLACCRFHGHRVKVLKMELEFTNAEKEVQPRVQA